MNNINDTLTYSIGSINLNGISSLNKVQALNSFVRLMDFDVIFMQEVESESLSLFGYSTVFNVDEKRRGTAIAVKNHYKLSNVERSLDGRIITARLGENTLLCNIYAPSGSANYSDREAFFSSRLPFFLRIETDNLILGGDFNSVERAEDSSGNSNFSPSLKRLTDSLQLKDTWIALNRGTNEYSFIRNGAFSRIDRIYVNQSLKDNISSVQFQVCAVSDHKVYIAKIRLPRTEIRYCQGLWSLKSIALSNENINEFSYKWQYWVRQKRFYDSWISWWLEYAKPKLTSFFKYKTKLIYDSFKLNMEFLYSSLKSAYDDYLTNPDVLTRINQIKGKMLNLQREFSKFYYKPNPHFCETEPISTAHLGVSHSRKKKTKIEKLVLEGIEIEDVDELDNLIVNHYEKLYTASEGILDNTEFIPQKTIDTNLPENILLMNAITEDEIFAAIKQSQSKKSPGTDGLTREFYIKTWQTIKNEMCLIFNEALRGNLPKKFLDGVIILIKKKDSNDSLDDYRPISLLNFDYKCFTKVMKNRLNKLTPYLLSDHQKCANNDKSIYDGLCAIRDKFTEVVMDEKPAALISFDLSQAFDRVEPKFVIDILTKMGINLNFISLYREITENSHSRLLINGRLTKEIKITRSVRQGDPLSMILFVLQLEPLIQKIASICNGSNDVLTVYADDITCIIDEIVKYQNILEEFKKFELVSGAKLNLRKTEYLSIGIKIDGICEKESIGILGIDFNKNFKSMVQSNWNRATKNLNLSLHSNSHRSLNLYQRVRFVNQFALSKIWYVGSIISLPNNQLAKIKSSVGWFIWKRRKLRIPLNQLFLNRKLGGLNLHSPEHKCCALLIKNCMKSSMNTNLFINYILPNISSPPNKKPVTKLPHIYPSLINVAYEHDLTESLSTNKIYSDKIRSLPRPTIENKEQKNWSRIWYNISLKNLNSNEKSILYLLVNRKFDHRAHMFRIGITDNPNCLSCGFLEDLEHVFCKCFSVNRIWNFFIRNLRNSFDPRLAQYLTFSSLIAPTLDKFSKDDKILILRKFAQYVQYILDTERHMISLSSFKFYLAINS